MKSKDLKVDKLPDKPGVYLFKGGPKSSKAGSDKDEILYIGKATSLRDRVRSYFGDDLIVTRGPLLVDMVFKSKKVDFIETDSVLEALILEANLIKKNQPLYNTKEKSDKSFCFVVITDEEFPRIFTIRGRELKKLKQGLSTFNFQSRFSFRKSRILDKQNLSGLSTVFGPFASTKVLREALRIIRKIFPFLDEKSYFVRSQINADRDADQRRLKKAHTYDFYKQIGLVPEISNKESIKEYEKTIRNIKLLFEGKKKTLIKKLEKEMKELAKKEEFKKAIRLRKQIFALQHIQDVALIGGQSLHVSQLGTVSPRYFRIEAFDISHVSGKSMVGVMTVVEDGEIVKSEYRKFKIRGYDSSNDPGALKEILERRFGHPEWKAPNLIVVDGGKAQLNATGYVLKKLDLPIYFVAVVKDERHKAKNILGDKKLIRKHESDILLANAESHRFAISFHRETEKKRLKFA